MKFRLLSVLALTSFVAYGACADEASTGLTGPAGNLEVAIAPLTLDGVEDSCLDIEVRTSTERVFAVRITSQQFGNGQGDASYIGTCDASEDTNTVFLDIVGVYDGTATCSADFEDGDQYDGASTNAFEFNDSVGIIEVTADCNENQDTLVEFDVTILRAANQGFFDIAVNFNDMFCSAKLDTCYGAAPGTDPIELLFGDDGREHTAVAGLACTAGTGATGSELVMTAPSVTCFDGVFEPEGPPPLPVTFSIDLNTAAQGNGSVTTTVGGGVDEPGVEYTMTYGLYYGNEGLSCGGAAGECQKVYYNVAVNLEGLDAQGLGDCVFDWTASAQPAGSDVITADGSLTSTSTTYPVISYASVPLTLAASGAEGYAPLCGQHPLNGDESNVSTQYIAPNQVFDVGDNDAHFNTYSLGAAAIAFDEPAQQR